VNRLQEFDSVERLVQEADCSFVKRALPDVIVVMSGYENYG